mgnify:FL=1
MPACVRSGLDTHVGHASPTPNPFHQTAYVGGSPNVSINSAASIRVGDATSCGDPAVAGSSTVRVNSIAIHRVGDATGGHGSWVANAASTGSSNVNAG